MKNNFSRIERIRDFSDARTLFPSGLTEFNDKLYFSIDGEVGDRELWVSDGTSEGTQLLTDIAPITDDSNPASSSTEGFVELNDRLYFAADDGENGSELWVSDGTSEGTQLLVDINGGSNDNGYSISPHSSSPTSLTKLNDRLYFAADDGENGSELWFSDGTSEGTQLLVDLNSGDRGSYPSSLTEFEGKVYFSANAGENGRELWVTDGTSEGTQILASIIPSHFAELDGKLYFSAYDLENGAELWVTDGTTEGTQLLADINPGNNYGGYYSYPNSSEPQGLTELNGKLYFSADDGKNGRELWVTDGTSEGTQLLADINPDLDGEDGVINGSNPDNLTELNGKLYFSADNGEGKELWVSDGTTQGTQLLVDIDPNDGSYPSDVTVVNDELYFFAAIGVADSDSSGTQGLYKLAFDSNDETILGTEEDDVLTGTNSADRIEALGGSDRVYGRNGNDTVLGGSDRDSLRGNNGSDELDGGTGRDVLFGQLHNDFLFGGDADDYLEGNRGQDTLEGNGGNDLLLGGRGNDLLQGGADDDFLNGNFGNDTLIGGSGNDLLVGGGGQDIFVLESNSGKDIIADFTNSRDNLGLSDGLAFDDLQIVQNTTETLDGTQKDVLLDLYGRNISASDTLIKSDRGDIMAVLLDVDATTIAQADFSDF